MTTLIAPATGTTTSGGNRLSPLHLQQPEEEDCVMETTSVEDGVAMGGGAAANNHEPQLPKRKSSSCSSSSTDRKGRNSDHTREAASEVSSESSSCVSASRKSRKSATLVSFDANVRVHIVENVHSLSKDEQRKRWLTTKDIMKSKEDCRQLLCCMGEVKDFNIYRGLELVDPQATAKRQIICRKASLAVFEIQQQHSLHHQKAIRKVYKELVQESMREALENAYMDQKVIEEYVLRGPHIEFEDYQQPISTVSMVPPDATGEGGPKKRRFLHHLNKVLPFLPSNKRNSFDSIPSLPNHPASASRSSSGSSSSSLSKTSDLTTASFASMPSLATINQDSIVSGGSSYVSRASIMTMDDSLAGSIKEEVAEEEDTNQQKQQQDGNDEHDHDEINKTSSNDQTVESLSPCCVASIVVPCDDCKKARTLEVLEQTLDSSNSHSAGAGAGKGGDAGRPSRHWDIQDETKKDSPLISPPHRQKPKKQKPNNTNNSNSHWNIGEVITTKSRGSASGAAMDSSMPLSIPQRRGDGHLDSTLPLSIPQRRPRSNSPTPRSPLPVGATSTTTITSPNAVKGGAIPLRIPQRRPVPNRTRSFAADESTKDDSLRVPQRRQRQVPNRTRSFAAGESTQDDALRVPQRQRQVPNRTRSFAADESTKDNVLRAPQRKRQVPNRTRSFAAEESIRDDTLRVPQRRPGPAPKPPKSKSTPDAATAKSGSGRPGPADSSMPLCAPQRRTSF